MLVVRPPAFINDDKNYYKEKKIYKKYDQVHHANKARHNYDIRLIVVRHGERIDQTLGNDWYNKVFGNPLPAPLQAYRHPSLPRRAPYRSNTLLYVFDPPITRTGEQQSYTKGQQLARIGATVDYCYSSPASRSVITANAILEGMNRKYVPICLEPYLFEPMNWNSALLAILGKMEPFMSTTDWTRTGYNINQRYKRINDYINPYENESDYYNRSQIFFQTIERRHGRISPNIHHRQHPRRHTNILVVGHASSTGIFQTIALRRPFDTNVFNAQCENVPYLHTVVLERDAINRIWYIRPIMQFV